MSAMLSVVFLPASDAAIIPISSTGFATGKIVLGTFNEIFHSSLSYWQPDEYQRHWRDALEILLRGCDRSALITDMYDPAIANFITWWPMWRSDETVYIQQHLLMMSEIPLPFDPAHLSSFVEDRKTGSPDEFPTSEWRISVKDIEIFLNSTR